MDFPASSLSSENAFEGIAPSSLSAESLQMQSPAYPSYDVFLNHRGPDVKKTLAQLIYRHLSAFNLRVFLDQNELQTGDFLPAAIQHALATCKVHVAIFSPNYAQSPWCLAELSFMLKTGVKIIPVFYDVEPFHARYVHTGPYALAFKKHEEKGRIDPQIVRRWKDDLYKVSFVTGLVFDTSKDDEEKLLKSIVGRVVEEAKGEVLEVAKHPVGLEEALQTFQSTVLESNQEHNDSVKVVGIVGKGGSGKTTLAKMIYNDKSWAYKGCSCFLSDVRSEDAKNGLASLQARLLEKLLHYDWKIDNPSQGKEFLKDRLLNLRVLIVLDDINSDEQINALLVKDVLGAGSLVILTSRDKGVLTSAGISLFHEVKGLGEGHAKELFCWHAFLLPFPLEGFEALVDKFLVSSCGLPLSLKVIGALLYKKDFIYWNGTLEKIGKHILPSGIIEKLRISFDALDREEKEIFLDIAWFFSGEEKNMLIKIWDASGWSSLQSLENLEQKCLIEFAHENPGFDREGEDRILIRMHDHLRDMGRDVIDHQSQPTRLWRAEDVAKYVSRNQLGMVTEVRGICIYRAPSLYVVGRRRSTWNACWMQVLELFAQVLSNVRGGESSTPCSVEGRGALRLLAAEGDSVTTDFANVSGHLLWLRWYDSPYASVPPGLSMHNLRVLELFGGSCDLRTLWHGHQQAPTLLRELYVRGSPGCSLLKLPKSICSLKYLEKLVVRLGNFKTLPDELCQLGLLNYLDLSHCDNLQSLPCGFGDLRNLRHLDLSHCVELQALPDSFSRLTQLSYLSFNGCQKLVIATDILRSMITLEYLDLNFSRLDALPTHITCQGFLKNLYVNCPQLKELPTDMGELSNLRVLEVASMELTTLPPSLGNLSCLKSLKVLNCPKLNCLPESIGLLTRLERLTLYQTGVRLLPQGILLLENLVELCVHYSPLEDMMLSSLRAGTGREALDTLGAIRNPLSDFSFKGMFSVKSISLINTKTTKLYITKDVCPALETLEVVECKNLMEVECLATILVKLVLSSCHRLKRVSGLSKLTKLRYLNISGCFQLEELEDLSQLSSLEFLLADGCSMLTKIKGLEHLQLVKYMQVTASHSDVWEGIKCLKELPSNVSSITLNVKTVGAHEREVDSVLSSFRFPLRVLEFSSERVSGLGAEEVKSCIAFILVLLCKSIPQGERNDPQDDLLILGTKYSMYEHKVIVKMESEGQQIIMCLFRGECMYLQDLKLIKVPDDIGVYARIPPNFETCGCWGATVTQGQENQIPQIWGKLFNYISSKQPVSGCIP